MLPIYSRCEATDIFELIRTHHLTPQKLCLPTLCFRPDYNRPNRNLSPSTTESGPLSSIFWPFTEVRLIDPRFSDKDTIFRYLQLHSPARHTDIANDVPRVIRIAADHDATGCFVTWGAKQISNTILISDLRYTFGQATPRHLHCVPRPQCPFGKLRSLHFVNNCQSTQISITLVNAIEPNNDTPYS